MANTQPNITHINQHLGSLVDLTQNPTLLLALSGGPDSVFLFHTLLALHNAGTITLRCVHVNHGWRKSATHDETFCRTLCSNHQVSLEVVHASTWHERVAAHKQASASRESLAREVRRCILEHYHAQYQAAGIVLAHHADDQNETFIMRLIRGASLTGLCGMHARNGHYLRPLLAVNKDEIMEWLTQNGAAYCHDETNDSPEHLRNRIRHTVLPALRACDERASANMQKTIMRLHTENAFLADLTSDLCKTFVNDDGWVKRAPFFNLHAVLRRRMILRLLIDARVAFTPSEGLLEEIERFLSRDTGGSHAISPEHAIVKKQGLFTVQKKTPGF